MALAIKGESTEVDTVLAACATTYAAQQIDVERLDLMSEGRVSTGRLNGIVAEAERRIECAVSRDSDISKTEFDQLVRSGWEVWVLVPIELMGFAHHRLRGVPVTLQPWWEGDSGILFGRPEIP